MPANRRVPLIAREALAHEPSPRASGRLPALSLSEMGLVVPNVGSAVAFLTHEAGLPLVVELGPGLLGSVYDGLQRSLIWEGHKAGRHIGYCHLEKLHNLEALPPSGCAAAPSYW